MGSHVIVQAFLRWAEKARANDRASAASALARAYLKSDMVESERQAAVVAMTYLLDDPAPQVRLALAEALAASSAAPRLLILSLAEDQLEIAAAVILRSPVLTEADMVDLVGRGAGHTRPLIAARPDLGFGVAAALAEVGNADDVLILLENDRVSLPRLSLRRIAERHGSDSRIRSNLLDREALPADSRHLLLRSVSDALSDCGLIRAIMGVDNATRVAEEAQAAAAVEIAGHARADECAALVEHMRKDGRLTPAFLMQTLCGGRTLFFSSAIASLSGLGAERVRSILATGRFHAVRALLESAGLSRAVSVVFVEAVLLWRQAQQGAADFAAADIMDRLLDRAASFAALGEEAGRLLEFVATLHRAEKRRLARDYATGLALAAA